MVVAGKCELQRNTESLYRHDGDRADGGADGQVNEGVLLSVDWCDLVNHENGEGDDRYGVEQESCNELERRSHHQSVSVVLTWIQRIVQDLIDRLNLFIWRGMQHNDDCSNQANGASKLAQYTELLVEEV